MAAGLFINLEFCFICGMLSIYSCVVFYQRLALPKTYLKDYLTLECKGIFVSLKG